MKKHILRKSDRKQSLLNNTNSTLINKKNLNRTSTIKSELIENTRIISELLNKYKHVNFLFIIGVFSIAIPLAVKILNGYMGKYKIEGIDTFEYILPAIGVLFIFLSTFCYCFLVYLKYRIDKIQQEIILNLLTSENDTKVINKILSQIKEKSYLGS
ncbi:MAG: hypothetical protein AAGU21_22015 [Solidesulfovibrio sp.]|uniref:hypothetical protein n=1 Tax=Solidesulfovibrio sp. TaxID=2910990 RepID=UPI0031586742